VTIGRKKKEDEEKQDVKRSVAFKIAQIKNAAYKKERKDELEVTKKNDERIVISSNLD
jgi:hypothetical protein